MEQPFATEEKRALQNDKSFFGFSRKTVCDLPPLDEGKPSFRVAPFSPNLRMSGNLTLKWGDSAPYWEQGLNSSMSLVNLSSLVLGLQSVGILQLFDPKLIAPVMVAYSDDYNEGNDDMLRILKLDGDGNLRIYSSKKGSGTVTVRWVAVEDQCEVPSSLYI
ncbi:Bulb-type lectin domain superfamily [Sesbania bispinosa]|nr:Bulb-type lectin domain superfamily [Sesbania bispinosa]